MFKLAFSIIIMRHLGTELKAIEVNGKLPIKLNGIWIRLPVASPLRASYCISVMITAFFTTFKAIPTKKDDFFQEDKTFLEIESEVFTMKKSCFWLQQSSCTDCFKIQSFMNKITEKM